MKISCRKSESGGRILILAIFFLLFAVRLPIHAASLSSGDLIKGSSDAVYYYGQNGKRYVFPNAKTYFTWYKDFSTVKTISATELAAIPIGGNVTYRPGVKLVKITTDPKVYAVAAHGTLRWMKTEALAISLYGTDWNKKIDDLPDTFFINYTVGAEISNASDFSPATETSTMKSINMDKKLVPIFDIPTSTESRSLKTLAEAKGVRFGAFYNYDRRSPRHDEIFEKEMGAATVYFAWSAAPGPKNDGVTPDIALYDEQISWGRARNMEVYGQTLVWFEELPEWLKATSTATVEGIMNRRIDTLMSRYKGQIKHWNVVNEAVDETGKLRQGHKWVEAMGNDYIRKAFVRAHAADPTAILYYNDFDIESNKAKFDGVKNLLIDLKKQDAPVHALGWQMHVTPKTFNAATLLERMNEIADLGFDNYITELDVELPENATAADYEQQKQTYKAIVKTFLQARRPPQSSVVGRYKTLIIWGIHDNDPGWLTLYHPYLFDENFNKKPAYFGVQEALK